MTAAIAYDELPIVGVKRKPGISMLDDELLAR